jgi:hypothetical protein
MAMLVSLAKFYQEVTGIYKGDRTRIMIDLKEWGIPFDPSSAPGKDAVDVAYIPQAKEAHAKKQEQKALRTKNTPVAALGNKWREEVAANTVALRDLQAAIELLTEKLTGKEQQP